MSQAIHRRVSHEWDLPSGKREEHVKKLEYLDLASLKKQVLQPELKSVSNSESLLERCIIKTGTLVKKIGISAGIGCCETVVDNLIISELFPASQTDEVTDNMCDFIQKNKHTFAKVVLIAPIAEEIFFRFGVQEVLLKRIPQKILEFISPSRVSILDSRIAKFARIGITAGAFAFAHLANQGVFHESYVESQLMSAFMGGIVYGYIKESRLGLLGAIVAHAAGNALPAIGLSFSCGS